MLAEDTTGKGHITRVVGSAEREYLFVMEDARRRFTKEIAAWPDGVYESDAYVDADPVGNRDLHVHCKITVDGSNLVVDFEGSDTRPDTAAWSTFGNTRGYTIGQLASLVDPTIPATNHRTEQALKTPIVNRKVWGGNRTDAGGQAQAVTCSVLQTCQKKALDVFSYLGNAFRGVLGDLFG